MSRSMRPRWKHLAMMGAAIAAAAVAWGVWAAVTRSEGSPAPEPLRGPKSMARPTARDGTIFAPDPMPYLKPAEPARALAAAEYAEHGGPVDGSFPEFSSDDEYFDPVAFRAVAERWLGIDEGILRAHLEEFAATEGSRREDVDLEKLGLLLAFLWKGDARTMPYYMLVDDADWVVPALRATFPMWPVLERGGIPFLLPSLVFDLSEPFRRGGGSFGVSGRGFSSWALLGARGPQLPPPSMDPLKAADDLTIQARATAHAAGGRLSELRLSCLRDQSFRCLGEHAQRAAAAQLGVELESDGAWFRKESAWSELRTWVAGQRLAWNARGRYELVGD